MPERKIFGSNLQNSAIGALLVGALFASGGWMITRIVDQVAAAPLLEYSSLDVSHCSITESCGDGAKPLCVIVENLSRIRKIDDLRLTLKIRDTSENSHFVKGKLVVFAPAQLARDRTNTTAGSVSFPQTGLHPGSKLGLWACIKGKAEPDLYVSHETDAPLAKKKGVLTWIVKKEIGILLALLVVWFLIVAAMLFVSGSGEANDQEN